MPVSVDLSANPDIPACVSVTQATPSRSRDELFAAGIWWCWLAEASVGRSASLCNHSKLTKCRFVDSTPRRCAALLRARTDHCANPVVVACTQLGQLSEGPASACIVGTDPGHRAQRALAELRGPSAHKSLCTRSDPTRTRETSSHRVPAGGDADTCTRGEVRRRGRSPVPQVARDQADGQWGHGRGRNDETRRGYRELSPWITFQSPCGCSLNFSALTRQF
ncbi:hypothetical protein Gbro_4734 [Gordonia bronchialis DSM 43247]|uniref:Uncharacterized protein n=1 Tax=Gordonia bronchialis (strain ATCC 25592 / DSM 43247 / BCRC 13721 / JCM 3198 / KCTC 3076 / NBRC 16047 / NCTC 10667) TaxID=526226 RepID=D0L8A5_GORB4|nr:hypothetical protein Gbro_4734 [Gordonia bronchialis DSM 43247]STQ66876.1 Uncharacterised protein [Gordonia bronchialis]